MPRNANTKTPIEAGVVSIERTAEMLGTSPRTVRNFISAGYLTGYRVGPRLIRISVDEINALLRPIPSAGGDAA